MKKVELATEGWVQGKSQGATKPSAFQERVRWFTGIDINCAIYKISINFVLIVHVAKAMQWFSDHFSFFLLLICHGWWC